LINLFDGKIRKTLSEIYYSNLGIGQICKTNALTPEWLQALMREKFKGSAKFKGITPRSIKLSGKKYRTLLASIRYLGKDEHRPAIVKGPFG
jgi:hypothetical protein